MLKQVPAKCPRRQSWSGTLMQGQARGPPDPTHTVHLVHLVLYLQPSEVALATTSS